MKMWSSKVYCLVMLSLFVELGGLVSGQDANPVNTCACCCEVNTDVIKDCNNVTEDDSGSGVHRIRPEDSEPFDALCVFDSDGKWTVIQQRVDGEVDFNRAWSEYRQGFGVKTDGGNLWLGLEKMHRITKQRQYRLRIDLQDWDDSMYYAEYSSFYVGDETSKYSLRISGYSGTLQDELIERADGQQFSTFDMDNDNWENNCAEHFVTGWWHDRCFGAQLNGPYRNAGNVPGGYAIGIIWNAFKGFYYSMKYSRMRIKPNFNN